MPQLRESIRVTVQSLPGRATVPVKSLLPADSPRLDGENEEHIRCLVEAGTNIPPILVHRSTMRVIDGMHRLRAAELRHVDSVEVEFFDGSESEAFICAVESNIAHGLPLSLADRRAAAVRIIASNPQMSDRMIARSAGLADKTIASIRAGSGADVPRLNERLGSDGRLYPVAGVVEGRRKAAELIAECPATSIRDIARRAGISVGTAHDVLERLRRGEDPVPRQRRQDRSALEPAGEPPPRGRGRSFPRDASRPLSMDRRGLLQRLGRDPSLRHTETGRKLLRLLNAHHRCAEDCVAMIDAIPPHCMSLAADLARQYSNTWREVAQELNRRVRTGV
jgi:ParB-like chromosome segregation protein Spo0J